MVFPLGDDNSDRTSFPIVNVSLIVANVLVFALLRTSLPPHDLPNPTAGTRTGSLSQAGSNALREAGHSETPVLRHLN